MQEAKRPDYRSQIIVNVTPEEAFEKITQAQGWWSKNFEGKSTKTNDVFTVRFPSGDMYKIRIAEFDPNRKIVWELLDSFQGWAKNASGWKGTKVVWEIKKENNGGVSIDMTHEGLVPELDTYDPGKKAWDWLTHESLYKFLTEGKGMPV